MRCGVIILSSCLVTWGNIYVGLGDVNPSGYVGFDIFGACIYRTRIKKVRDDKHHGSVLSVISCITSYSIDLLFMLLLLSTLAVYLLCIFLFIGDIYFILQPHN